VKTAEKVHLLRSASYIVVAAYAKVRLTPQYLPALHLELFAQPFAMAYF
jgi:hypothetical protein